MRGQLAQLGSILLIQTFAPSLVRKGRHWVVVLYAGATRCSVLLTLCEVGILCFLVKMKEIQVAKKQKSCAEVLVELDSKHLRCRCHCSIVPERLLIQSEPGIVKGDVTYSFSPPLPSLPLPSISRFHSALPRLGHALSSALGPVCCVLITSVQLQAWPHLNCDCRSLGARSDSMLSLLH